MEKVEGAELAVEEEIVDGVSVPKYVHPNTHISGFYPNTHTQMYISGHPETLLDIFRFHCLLYSLLLYPI